MMNLDHIQHLTPEEKIIFETLVDESPYSLSDWLYAHAELTSYMKNHGIKKSFTEELQYLACCSEGLSQSGIRLPFKEGVGIYLKTYGVA